MGDNTQIDQLSSKNNYKEWLLGTLLGFTTGIPCIFLLPNASIKALFSFEIILFAVLFFIFFIPLIISFSKPKDVWRWAFAVELGFMVCVFFLVLSENDKYPLDTISYAMFLSSPFAFLGAYAGLLLNQWAYKEDKHQHIEDAE